jgi:protein TonB
MTAPRHFGTLPLVIALHLLGLAGLLWHNPATPHAPPRVAPLWLVPAAVSTPATPPAPLRTPTRALKPAQVLAPPAPRNPLAPAPPSVAASAVPTQSPTPAAAASQNQPLPAATPPENPPSPAAQAAVPSVSAPVFNAAYLNNPAPAYPPLLRRAGEQGKVILRVLVNADGHADEVRVQHSSGQSMFDEAALDAVRKWRFVPARRGEAVVAEWVQVPIEFRLG